MAQDQSAHQLWVTIEGPFLANKVPHKVFLHEVLSFMKQGTSTTAST